MRRLLCIFAIMLSMTCRAEDGLFPYAMPWNDTAANLSNLSDWNDKPAGREGFVSARDGHLWAGDKRLRLIGVNIVFGSCFPSHQDAEGVAARLARIGVNIVRFHHMDSTPTPRGLLQKDMRTLDPAQLEKLDYFIAALKRQGIYSDLNLHVGRMYPGFASWGERAPKYWKGVDNFFAPMIAQQKDYARDLLNHVNAYTGKRYAEEPAVAFIEINNENGLLREWRSGSLDEISEPYRGALQAQWTHWLGQRYAGDAALAKAWGAREVALGAEMLGARFGVGSGESGWNLQVVGGAKASYSTQADGSAELKITAIDADRWHVQWHQNKLQFKAGEPYTLSLRLKADRPLRLRLQAMQAHAPWAHLWESELAVGTEWRDYRFSFAPTADEADARLTLGDLGASLGSVSLASASLKPGGSLGLMPGESLAQGSIAIPTTSNFLSRTLPGQQDWLQFLWDTEVAYWRGMQDFLKQDLGAKSLIIGTQVSYSPAPIQAQLDVVDGHAYWQHPNFPGKPWDIDNWRIGNTAMAGIDGGGTLAELALRRVPGKPFVVTEYNHPAPNEFSAEAFPLLAAYAALQDWDGFFVYSYGAHDGDWNPGRIINFFDTHADPVKISSLISAAALFRRGDVARAPLHAAVMPSQSRLIEALRRNYKMPSADMWGAPRNASLQSQVSIAAAPGADLPLPVRSDTGELLWGVEQKATVSIDTPRSKGLIGAALAQPFKLGGVSMQLLQSATGSGVLMATLIEGQRFSEKGRVLITALGREENTDQRWLDAKHSSLGRNFGRGPVRVEGIHARISLPVAASRVQAWALDERGNRRQALPVSGDAQAQLDTGPQYRALWYELEIR
ncbi:carbohydrate binding domain-containing protein [Uliginosibacterium sediminicola]|uniref:Carbohydrate binding domain-containing protein n=1 Tax=Uliginosibacterium sediminicola TaxID=2024550 RepID=A0ABU9YZY7_9RHOO